MATSTDDISNSNNVPIVLKSKLLIVDLAGSERIDKSGIDQSHLTVIFVLQIYCTIDASLDFQVVLKVTCLRKRSL